MDIRQGLTPSPFTDNPMSFGQTTSGQRSSWRVSPDKTKAILTGSQGYSQEVFVVTDTETMATVNSALYSGTVNGCDVSNTHYAVCGVGGKLLVATFAGATVVLNDVSTMGDGLCCAFSPDGTKLAVRHSTSPGLRVYNLADGTYQNASGITYWSIGSVEADITYTPNGEYIVFSTDAAGDRALTAVRADTLANPVYTPTGQNFWYCNQVLPDPTNPKGVISHQRAYTGATGMQIFRFNAETGATSRLPEQINNLAISAMAADAEENRLYVSHGAWIRDGSTRRLSYLNLDTLAWGEPIDHGEWVSAENTRRRLIITGKNTHRLTGSVRDIDNAPAARVVRAFARVSGNLVAQTMSNATTGEYTLSLPSAGPFDVQFMAENGEQLNDLFYARSEPEPV